MLYMCLMEYADSAAMAKVRPKHRTYMTRLVKDGKVLAAGSFLPER
jgi:uncharacterized protein YciI